MVRFNTPYNYVDSFDYSINQFESDLQILESDTSVDGKSSAPLDSASFTNSDKPSKYFGDIRYLVVDPRAASDVVASSYPTDPVSNPIVSE